MRAGDKVKPIYDTSWEEGIVEDLWFGDEGVRINVTKSKEGVIWACARTENVEVKK